MKTINGLILNGLVLVALLAAVLGCSGSGTTSTTAPPSTTTTTVAPTTTTAASTAEVEQARAQLETDLVRVQGVARGSTHPGPGLDAGRLHRRPRRHRALLERGGAVRRRPEDGSGKPGPGRRRSAPGPGGCGRTGLGRCGHSRGRRPERSNNRHQGDSGATHRTGGDGDSLRRPLRGREEGVAPTRTCFTRLLQSSPPVQRREPKPGWRSRVAVLTCGGRRASRCAAPLCGNPSSRDLLVS